MRGSRFGLPDETYRNIFIIDAEEKIKMMDNLMKDIRKVLITREQLQKRVAEMGQEITRDYQGRDVVLVGILEGG